MFLDLLPPNRDDRLLPPGLRRPEHRPWSWAAGSTLLAHIVLLSLLGRMAAIPPGASGDVTALSLILLPPAAPEARGAVAATPAPGRQQTRPVAASPDPVDPPYPLAAEVARTAPSRLLRSRTPARMRPPTTLRSASRPAASAGIGGAPDEPDPAPLEAAIDQAVRSAATMPASARRQRREGRVLVHFSYLDGAVGGVSVRQSARSSLLDDAAVQAVQRASYPPPPPGLQGRRLDLVVWIDFRLAPS